MLRNRLTESFVRRTLKSTAQRKYQTTCAMQWSALLQSQFSSASIRQDIVYTELHRQAHRYLQKERIGHTLQTTALVHEAYLRLVEQKSVAWESR